MRALLRFVPSLVCVSSHALSIFQRPREQLNSTVHFSRIHLRSINGLSRRPLTWLGLLKTGADHMRLFEATDASSLPCSNFCLQIDSVFFGDQQKTATALIQLLQLPPISFSFPIGRLSL